MTVNVPMPSPSPTVKLSVEPPECAVDKPISIPSSSVITKSAVASEMVALVGLDRVKVAVSLSSLVASLVTGTSMVPVVAPAKTVNVPLVAV